MDEMAREHAADAIDTIARVMNDDCAEDRDKIRAAEALLDRGYGKAAQAIIQVPASRKQEAILAALSDEQLVAIIESKQLPRLTQSQPLITVEPAPHRNPPTEYKSPHGPAIEIYTPFSEPGLIDSLLL